MNSPDSDEDGRPDPDDAGVIGSAAAVDAALEVAAEGMRRGEMPIGAVVFLGDEPIARAHTEERAQRRRIVHADLLAMLRADALLGFAPKPQPLTLAVNLEPCMMCLGAAITLGVERVVYALESPNDGAVDLLNAWAPPNEQPFFKRPAHIEGGVLRHRSQELFARYAAGDGPAGMRAWARGLAEL